MKYVLKKIQNVNLYKLIKVDIAWIEDTINKNNVCTFFQVNFLYKWVKVVASMIQSIFLTLY